MKTIVLLLSLMVVVLAWRLNERVDSSIAKDKSANANEHDAWDNGFLNAKLGYSYSQGQSNYVRIVSKYHGLCTNCYLYAGKK